MGEDPYSFDFDNLAFKLRAEFGMSAALAKRSSHAVLTTIDAGFRVISPVISPVELDGFAGWAEC